MPQKRRGNMARLFNSRLNSQSKLFPIENSDGRRIHGNRTPFDILRFIIVIGCVILFALNSYAIFRDFLSNPTIISTKVLKSEDGRLAFPLILICNESSFKQPIMATDFDGYRKNTVALNDFLIDILLLNNAGHSIIKAKPISIKHSIEEIYTAFHGTCFLVKENIKVFPEDVIFLELNSKFDLKIYPINPGDEVFVPLNIWPINPPEQLLSNKNEYIHIEFKKESKVSRKNCNDSLNFVYGECIRQNLKEFFNVEQKELFMACNVPWTLSLKNISLAEAIDKNNCSVEIATHQSLKLIEFFYRSSSHLFSNCKAPCYTSTYKSHTTQFEKSNAITKYMTEGYRQRTGIKRPNNTETYSVVINYDTSDVVVSEEIHLTTLPDFISSVGGNLGLFIGFSCLPVLLKATDYFCNFKITKTINFFGNK